MCVCLSVCVCVCMCGVCVRICMCVHACVNKKERGWRVYCCLHVDGVYTIVDNREQRRRRAEQAQRRLVTFPTNGKGTTTREMMTAVETDTYSRREERERWRERERAGE